MMGLSDYWNRNRVQMSGASFSPASSGSDSSDSSDPSDPFYSDLGPPGTREPQECVDSTECASGWACVGGKCQQSDTGAGDDSYGDTSGCGGGSGGGGGGGGCGASTGDSGSGTGCTKSGCGGAGGSGGGGGGGNADDCCGGERCCRNGSCTCGPCPPPPPRCNQWCDEYLKANGKRGEGCSEECTECEECIDGACESRNNGPCNCYDAPCSAKCAKCTEKGYCEDDCSNCQTCYTISKECSCGTVTKTCCYSACDQSKGYGDCRDSIKCDDECPPGGGGGGGGGDPCAGDCRTELVCDGPPPPCPPGSSCSETGGISGGGQDCTLRTICDKTNVPDSCRDCDCNCQDDCPECQICNPSGECEPDPECEQVYSVWYREPASFLTPRCVDESCVMIEGYQRPATIRNSARGRAPHRLVQIRGTTPAVFAPLQGACFRYWRCNGGSCDGDAGEWHVVDGDGKTVLAFTGEIPAGACNASQCCTQVRTYIPPTFSLVRYVK